MPRMIDYIAMLAAMEAAYAALGAAIPTVRVLASLSGGLVPEFYLGRFMDARFRQAQCSSYRWFARNRNPGKLLRRSCAAATKQIRAISITKFTPRWIAPQRKTELKSSRWQAHIGDCGSGSLPTYAQSLTERSGAHFAAMLWKLTNKQITCVPFMM